MPRFPSKPLFGTQNHCMPAFLLLRRPCTNIIISEMSQRLIILPMQGEYPFTSHPGAPSTKFQVQQTIATPASSKGTILAKANYIKNLKNRYLVKVEQLLEEDEQIHVLYEYVEQGLEGVLEGASVLVVSKFAAQLRELGRFLSNVGVRILFGLDRMGFAEGQCLKYFMGLDFTWEDDPDEEFLQQFYNKQIDQILEPYLQGRAGSELPPSHTGHSTHNVYDKYRKISYATLPSNTLEKRSEQRIQQNYVKNYNVGGNSQNLVSRKQSTVDTSGRNHQYRVVDGGYTKRKQDRKYSTDVKIESRGNRYQAMENDIHSEYGNNKKQLGYKSTQPMNQELMPSQRNTMKTKSKADQVKQKQYSKIANTNKSYLKQFMSVLESDEQQPATPSTPAPGLTIRRADSTSIVLEGNSSEMLQQMAARAIENSVRVMERFRALVYSE